MLRKRSAIRRSNKVSTSDCSERGFSSESSYIWHGRNYRSFYRSERNDPRGSLEIMFTAASLLMGLVGSKGAFKSNWARSQIQLLHKIIREQDVEGCKEFVKDDIDWNEILPYGPEEGEDPIYLPHHLMFYHLGNNMNMEILRMLLESGLSPNFGDRTHRTALHYLIRKLHYQRMFTKKDGDADDLLVSYLGTLCSYGANPNAQDITGNTPMHLAAVYNYPGCNTLLKHYGGDLETEDSRGISPFLKAVEYGSFQVMEELITLGVDVHRTDSLGRTALHALGKFSRMHRLQCMKFLLAYHLDINRRDLEGSTCLHLAARSKAPEDIVVEMLQNGADPDVRNNLGHTALYEYLDNQHLWGNTNCRFVVHPRTRTHRRSFFNVSNAVSSSDGLCHILDNTTILRIRDEHGRLPLLLRKADALELTNFLVALASTPPSLKRLCRQAVRKSVGPERLADVRQLEIPKSLQFYISRPLCFSKLLVTVGPPPDPEDDVVQNDLIGGSRIVYFQFHDLQ